MSTHTSSIIRGTAQMAAIVPYLLDYRPDDSLVVIGARVDPDCAVGQASIGMSLRVDLPQVEHLDGFAHYLLAPLTRSAEGVPLLVHAFVYDDRDEAQHEDEAARDARCYLLMEAFAARLDDEPNVPFHAFGVIRGQEVAVLWNGGEPVDGAWDGTRIPAKAWVPLPPGAEVPAAADLVLQGRNPQRRRSDVVSQVRRRDEELSAAADLCLSMTDLKPERFDLMASVRQLGRWVVLDEGEPTHRERAEMALAVQEALVRDLFLGRWLPDLFPMHDHDFPAELAEVGRELPRLGGGLGKGAVPGSSDEAAARVAVDRLLTLASGVPEDYTPPLLTLAACLSWGRGEGTLANEAVDLALEIDPGYRMALLLRHVLIAGISPRSWAKKVAA
ncbi:DUF4192 domain-containing protein [Ornithinimicrobium sp. Y1694]|uniref:DUF4192 domain-containing protein n=1 Tax=Ornithinimicrobium sp. Y1694 TaxID=3418590 RepID=UPI003CE95207